MWTMPNLIQAVTDFLRRERAELKLMKGQCDNYWCRKPLPDDAPRGATCSEECAYAVHLETF